MNKIFIEENAIYQIDLTKTMFATGSLHEKYNTIGNFLADVDFIAETETEIFLIEYKNSAIATCSNEKAFVEKITRGKLAEQLLKKYYNSMFYILSCKKYKKINFICIIECKNIDDVIRKKLKASVRKRLPYELQELEEIKTNLITNFEIISINDWNKKYARFPLTKVGSEL